MPNSLLYLSLMIGQNLKYDMIGFTSIASRQRLNQMTDSDLWCAIRQACLLIVDAIERVLDIRPRTSELRKDKKNETNNRDC